MTIFAHMPHTHLIGRSFYSKLVRNKKEIAWIGNNKYFDFNYQYTNFLQEEVVVQKGDEISISCVYNTEKIQNGFTVGGLGTHDEMCIDFIWYYPRNKDYAACFQIVDYSEWYNFFDNLNKTGQISWKYSGKPETFFTSALQSVMDSGLVKDPARLEGMFQALYNSANRTFVDVDTRKTTPVGKINIQRIADNDCRTATTTTQAAATTTTTRRPNSAGRASYQLTAFLFPIGLLFLA